MSTLQKNKKRMYTKDEFSDKEVYNEIKDEIKSIRDKNYKQVEEDSLINNLYETKKQEMKIKRMRSNEELKPKAVKEKNYKELADDDEEGEIVNHFDDIKNENLEENAPSINDLGDHIKPITITRNKMVELMKSRKFEDIIKGCFVRYKSENSTSYILALVIGVVEGEKEYSVNNIKTKTLLKLQQSTSEVIKLSLDNFSNQAHLGSLEISKWLQTNRNKIPKEKELKEKLDQLNNLIHGKVSSQEIDKNLFEEATAVANGRAEGTQKISELIFFMKNHLHDVVVTLDEIEGDESRKVEFAAKEKEKNSCESILKKLIEKESEVKAQQKIAKEEKDKKNKSKGYSDFIFGDRKEDRIKEVYHNNIISLCSFESSTAFIKKLSEAHNLFDLDVEI